MPESERYIILPKRGIRASRQAELDVLASFPAASSTGPATSFRLDTFGGGNVSVVDTVADHGPKLVDLSAETAALINASSSPVRAVKEVFYPLPRPAEGTVVATAAAAAAAGNTFQVEVVDAQSHAPIAFCPVTAFTNFQLRAGAGGVTDAQGKVTLTVSDANLDRVLATPAPGAGYWGGYARNVPASGTIQIAIPPFAMPFTDSVRHYYGATNYMSATGVVVGVVDTGCGPHADLNIIGGRNTVTGEPASAFTDGDHHGTHVAGLVGARGTAANGIRGVAPGIPLRAYRVFGSDGNGASNYAILKAMILAAEQSCDIINLSLGGGPHNEIVEEAILDARNQGMLIVIAAGNDYRAAVSFPAAYPGATAVSAIGRQGFVPPGASDELQAVTPPYATVDPQEYVAAFSNVGPNIRITAPGVGAISTLPNNKIGPLSGTSMAAPVIAGAAACLLSQNAAVWQMNRDRSRSDAIELLLQSNSRPRGFGFTYEGIGLPQSPQV